jgi:hypothetical protein
VFGGTLNDMNEPSFAAFIIEERNKAHSQLNHAIAERDSAIAERDSAIAERDSAIAERDSAIAERDIILNSVSWKATMPYRWFRNKF